MAYRRPAETRKDRVNQAIANYAARNSDNVPFKKMIHSLLVEDV